MSSIAENYRRVTDSVAETALSCGRNPADITIVTVTKTHPAPAVLQALLAGTSHIGESKIREAESKFTEIERVSHPSFTRHLIGHLQTNKAGKAVQLFDLIQSVDSLRLGQTLSHKAAEVGKIVDILLEVNTSGEISKFGAEPHAAIALTEKLAQLPNLHIQGLMTIGAFLPDSEKVRPCFELLRSLSENIAGMKIPGVEMKWLSMGMSGDYCAAIKEGSNMLRIGTAIMGERIYAQ